MTKANPAKKTAKPAESAEKEQAKAKKAKAPDAVKAAPKAAAAKGGKKPVSAKTATSIKAAAVKAAVAKEGSAGKDKKPPAKAATVVKAKVPAREEEAAEAPRESVAEPRAEAPAAPRPEPKAQTAAALGEPKPAVGFSNSGLSIRPAPKKPALSVAPGAMILGRPAPMKVEAPQKTAERKLSKKEFADIKNFLLERRERLLAGMRREFALQRERAESKAADDVDKATDAYDEDLSFEIATANDQELEEIQVALEKIERGTYGECEICGCNISPSRLKILPSATTCVSCRGQEELARRRDESPNFNMLGGEEAETETPEA